MGLNSVPADQRYSIRGSYGRVSDIELEVYFIVSYRSVIFASNILIMPDPLFPIFNDV